MKTCYRESKGEQELLDVSIVMVSYNQAAYLERALETIYQTIQGLSFEVIVVDNASTDDTVERIRFKYPQVKLVENGRNYGFPIAINRGIQFSRGRYILVLSTDTELLPNSVSAMMRILDSQPSVSAVGCRLMWPDGRTQVSCGPRFYTLLSTFMDSLFVYAIMDRFFPRMDYPGRYAYSPEEHDVEREVEWLSFPCLLVRREVLDDVGLWDEKIFLYGEDWDWCQRARARGHRLLYTPSASVVHLQAKPLGYSTKAGLSYWFDSMAYLFNKRGGRVSGIIFLVLRFIGAVVSFLPMLLVYAIWARKRTQLRKYLDADWNSIVYLSRLLIRASLAP